MNWNIRNDAPVYTQLVDQIARAIILGQFPPGGRLPSVREFAADAGVNPNTMQRAFAELERLELIRTQRTAGRTVTEDIARIEQEKRRLAQAGIDAFWQALAQLGYDRAQALELLHSEFDIDLLLLDINMPRLDGFGVLEVMKQRNWLQEIPVIITSSEDDESFIQKAYELGVTDHIRRPFNLTVTQRRVSNALTLYARQKHLVRLAEEQVYEREKTNSAIINILSHVVESRNFESGTHILHVRAITDILLRQLICTFRNGAQNRKEASWLTTNFSLACSPQRRR